MHFDPAQVTRFILEKSNDLAMINSYVLWTYLLWYFVRRSADLPKGSIDQMLISKDVARHALGLAFALLVRETGTVITRTVVAVWRRGIGGSGGQASIGQAIGLTIGAMVLVAGSILLIRVLSRPLYGNRLWVLVGLTNIAYVAVTAEIWR